MKEELLEKIKEFDKRRAVFSYLCDMTYPIELQKSFQEVRHYLLELNKVTNEEIGKIARESMKNEI